MARIIFMTVTPAKIHDSAIAIIPDAVAALCTKSISWIGLGCCMSMITGGISSYIHCPTVGFMGIREGVSEQGT